MKTISTLLFFLLTLFVSNSAYAFGIQDLSALIDNPKKYLLENPSLLNTQFEMMLKRRCLKYSIENASDCERASKDFIDILDLQTIEIDVSATKKQKYVVSFVNDLEKLHNDPVALLLLKRIDSELTQLSEQVKLYKFIAPSKIKSIDLGQFAYSYYHTTFEVHRFYAVLFQDLPQTQVQTHYLYNKYGADQFTTILHSILDKFTGLRINEKRFALSLYGKELFNEKIYHLFVPAYLSAQLKQRGHSDETSILLPFLFNYIYEIGELGSPFVAYFKEPSSITAVSAQSDILSGLLGAQVGAESFVIKMSDEDSRKLLTISPKAYIQKLVSNLGKN